MPQTSEPEVEDKKESKKTRESLMQANREKGENRFDRW